MGTLTELNQRRRPAAAAQIKRATVRTEPDGLTDKVMVSIDDQPGYLRGPCPWPQGGPVPQKGDTAYVAETNDGELAVVLVWSDDPQFS